MRHETDPAKNNPIVMMTRLQVELWDEYKCLNHACSTPVQYKRQINKIEKVIEKINLLMPKLLAEPNFLRSLYDIK